MRVTTRGLIITLLIILVISLLGLGGYSGYCFLTAGASTPFTDTVLFVMTLVGVLIALTSVGIFYGVRRLLEEDIHKRIKVSEKCARGKAQFDTYHQIATAFLRFYEEKGNPVFINQTIVMAERARIAILEAYETLKEEEPPGFKKEAARYEGEICKIFNNLAFALAMRGKSEDTAMAHYLAEYTNERIKYYPEDEVLYQETLAYVLWKLPKVPQDKKRGLALLKTILKRPDVSTVTKKEYLKRYKVSEQKH